MKQVSGQGPFARGAVTADVYKSPIYRNVDTLFTYDGVKSGWSLDEAPTRCHEAAESVGKRVGRHRRRTRRAGGAVKSCQDGRRAFREASPGEIEEGSHSQSTVIRALPVKQQMQIPPSPSSRLSERQ